MFLGRREKTPTPETRVSTWTLLRTPGRFTTRPLPVHFTTNMFVVRPFSVLRKDEIGPHSKTDRFLTKAESWGWGSFPLFQILSLRFNFCVNGWDSPDPRQGPESPFPRKEGSGVQKPPFPLALTRPGKGRFFVKKSPFSLCSLVEKGGFFRAEKTMTATDVTGFDAIFSTGFFATFSRF